MALVSLFFETTTGRPGSNSKRFLRAAVERVERYQSRFHVSSCVSSDFSLVDTALSKLASSGLASGDRFAEWGSGHGVVSCLATLAGFDAYGFEVQGSLVRAARRLAADFDLPTEFARGSFIPSKVESGLLDGCEFARLTTGERCGHEVAGIGIEEFDLVYAYPWPDEESLVERLFEGHAKSGALLMTYNGEGSISLRRKA